MSSRQKLILLVTIGTSALVFAGVTTRALGPRIKQQPASGEGVQDLREEVRRLQSKIAQVESGSARRLAVLSREIEQAKSTPSSDTERPVPNSESSEARAAEDGDEAAEQAALVAQLENEFDAEAVDPEWSRGAVTEATRALSHDLPAGSKLGKIACRAKMCRVESSHDNLQAFQAFVQSALLSRSKQLWNAGISSHVVDQSRAGVSAVTFVGREDPADARPKSVPN